VSATKPTPADEFIGARAAARILGVPEHRFRQWVKKGWVDVAYHLEGGAHYARYRQDHIRAVAESEAEMCQIADAAYARALRRLGGDPTND
jgi:hypothetical protein